MIDFRYHLVSIVSIFLALAVGIVLGAGPLKGSIGDTLTSELANVRKDKADLNDQLTAARRLQTSSNAFAGAVLGPLVEGRLAARKVALVVGPQASATAQKAVTDAVTKAGGELVTTVTVTDDMLSAAHATARAQTIRTLADTLSVDSAKDEDLAGAVLGRALLSGAPGGPTFSGVQAATTMSALTEAGLVKRPSAQPGSGATPVPTLVVVVPGAVPTGTAAETTAWTNAYLGLVRGLDGVAAGTVLAAAYPTQTTPGSAASVITAARASNTTSEIVSTVDDVDLPMGEAALALALAAEPSGTAGRYGVLDDAQAVLPAVTSASATPSASSTPTPSATPSTSASTGASSEATR